MPQITVDEWEYNDLKRRVEFLEAKYHRLWQMFHPQFQFMDEIDRIERLIDHEEYTEAKRRIERLRPVFSESVELVGVNAKLDMILFLGKNEDKDNDQA